MLQWKNPNLKIKLVPYVKVAWIWQTRGYDMQLALCPMQLIFQQIEANCMKNLKHNEHTYCQVTTHQAGVDHNKWMKGIKEVYGTNMERWKVMFHVSDMKKDWHLTVKYDVFPLAAPVIELGEKGTNWLELKSNSRELKKHSETVPKFLVIGVRHSGEAVWIRVNEVTEKRNSRLILEDKDAFKRGAMSDPHCIRLEISEGADSVNPAEEKRRSQNRTVYSLTGGPTALKLTERPNKPLVSQQAANGTHVKYATGLKKALNCRKLMRRGRGPLSLPFGDFHEG